jgi:hypothetical protein
LFCASVFAQELPMKTVELEWESVENAFGYQVRLTPEGGGKPLIFRTLEPKLVQEVPVGVYALRVRSRHKEVEDVWSPWSEALRLEVLVKELVLQKPLENSVLVAKSDGREEVEFEWTQIEKAKDYVLKIWTEETKDKPITFVAHKNTQRLKLLPGRVYFWTVTFESATRVSYAQKEHVSTFTLQGRKLVMPSIAEITAGEVKEFSWIGSPKAKAYKAKLFFRYLDEKKWQVVKEDVLPGTKWPVDKLHAGVYKLEVVATAPRYTNSDTAVIEHVVKPTEAELTAAIQ